MPKHSSNFRLLQVSFAIIWCLFAAGPIFGFAALKPVLISQGVYHHLCDISTDFSSNLCVAQDLKLNKMFTIGAVVTNATSLVVGYTLDHYGPRICGFIGSILIFIGALFLAQFLSFVSFLDPYLMGYVFLALGGPFVFISSFQLANSFPKYSGMILAFLTGAFDTSSAVFLGYRIVYQNYAEVSLRVFFSLYLIIPIFIFLCQLFIMPSESYKTLGIVQKLNIEGLDENGQLLKGDDGSHIIHDANERTSLLSANSEALHEPDAYGVLQATISQPTSLVANGTRRKSVYEEYVEHEITQKSGNIFGILDGKPLSVQLKSPFFYIMGLFTTVQMIRINYFVATIRSQEEYLIGDDLAVKINNIFDIALPLGGVIAIPFIGILLDNCKTVNILIILLSITTAIGTFGLFHSFVLNLAGILLLVVYRPFYYTAVSDYSAKVFGFDNFGTVYGLMMSISGLFNVGQTVLDYITKTYENNNPTPVNIGLIATTLLFGGSLIAYIFKQQKNITRIQLEAEAENAPEVLIPQ